MPRTRGRRTAWSVARIVVPAVGLPTAATALVALLLGRSAAIAALAYVLAVIGAAVLAGLWSGLVAALASFLLLNFFFTSPFHRFAVASGDDVAALVVFLVVSVVVGTLVSRALEQRSRAERRQREAVLLQHLATRLLSGEAIEPVLRSFAESLVRLVGLRGISIETPLTASPVNAGEAGEPAETFPMSTGEGEVGVIRAALPPGREALDPSERDVISTFAGQVALALQGLLLSTEAREARSDAETSRTRAALFSSVTHDLRTPLSSIMASVTSLLDERATFSDEEGRDLLQTIRQEADRLNRLVGNLLDLSRVRAGALEPQKRPAGIDDLIEGVVARLEPALRGHELRLIIRDNLPELPVDVVQIDQVLTNLLENAAKFTPRGKRITVSAAAIPQGVQVRVADQGPGVPPDERERVFEPFVRSEGEGGAGLGLSIARAIVESHGGRIRVEGAPGGGTAVVFELPADGRL